MEQLLNCVDKIKNATVGNETKQKTREETDKIMSRYPDRIPVLIKKNPNAHSTPDIDKSKYLVPVDMTVGQLMYVIRKRLKMNSEQALSLFVDNTVVCNSELVSTVYFYSHNTQDGFLHAMYSCENVFGSTFSKVEQNNIR